MALDNVVLVPHIGSATVETRAAMAQRVFDNLQSFFATGKLISQAHLSPPLVAAPRPEGSGWDGPARRAQGEHAVRENRLRTLWQQNQARHQRLAGHPQQLQRRGDGPPGLGHADDRHAARRDRLRADGDDAAGDQHHGHGADRARAVAGARHRDEGARRRRLRRHLPDGQHARRCAAAGRVHALRAARQPQLRPGARQSVRRQRLRRQGQRHHRRVRDDRNQAGAGQPRRHPLGRRARCDLHRPVGFVALAWLPPGARRRRSARRRRPSPTSWRAPRRMACAPPCTTALPEVAQGARGDGVRAS